MISIYTNVADAIISVDGNFIINAKNETNTFRVGGGDNLITIRRDADEIAAGSDANFISARGGADTIVGSHLVSHCNEQAARRRLSEKIDSEVDNRIIKYEVSQAHS
jgi:hypothetical protein